MGTSFSQSEFSRVGQLYANRVVLYVESREDLEVLRDRWFREWSEWIEFQAVDRQDGSGGGGSCQVHRRVQEDRKAHIDAYGIVDRDVLLSDQVMRNGSHWSAFMQTDHDAFEAASYLGPYIKILRRWEIENYLLHPVAIGKMLNDAGFSLPDRCSADKAAQCILDFSPVAILMTAANLVLLENDRRPLKELFGKECEDLPKLTTHIVKQLDKNDITDAQEKIDIKCNAIRAFLHDQTGTPESQWDQLNHLIDGKLFLTRFCEWIGFSEDKRKVLATMVCDGQLIDTEISAFMEVLKNKATESR
ncbi:MAG: DUF4435 domain-containing protein [Magnetococcales bacterium]|nr:DUF4435 domain-containing protein [Magnetococcales bacterium]